MSKTIGFFFVLTWVLLCPAMALRKALFLVVVLPAAVGVAQNPAMQRGSLELYRFEAGLQRRAMLAIAEWNGSQKLTILDSVPKTPRSGLRSVDLINGTIGYIEECQFNVLQVVGPTDLLLGVKHHPERVFWLADHKTDGLADSDAVRLVGPIEVRGTNSYVTVAGAQKTVRVLRFISPEQYAKAVATRREARDRANEARDRANEEQWAASEARKWGARWAAEKHTWTDKSGKHSVEAVYDAYLGNGNIRLLRKDQTPITIHLSRLSEKDRRKAVSLRAQQSDAE